MAENKTLQSDPITVENIGTVVFRRPNILTMIAIGLDKAKYLGNVSEDDAPVSSHNLAHILSTLSHTLVQKPAGLNLAELTDPGDLFSLYQKYLDWVDGKPAAEPEAAPTPETEGVEDMTPVEAAPV